MPSSHTMVRTREKMHTQSQKYLVDIYSFIINMEESELQSVLQNRGNLYISTVHFRYHIDKSILGKKG